MFRRISGSSSMTNIFFIVRSKNGNLHRHGCALADLAVELHLPAVQFGAAFHQQQAKARARTCPHVAAAMKGVEHLLLIFFRNANPLVTNHTHCVMPVPRHREMHRRSGLGIFHGVAQEIGKNVSEQSFIRLCFGGMESSESSMRQRRLVAERTSSTTRRQKMFRSSAAGSKINLPGSSRLRTRTSSIMPAIRRVF